MLIRKSALFKGRPDPRPDDAATTCTLDVLGGAAEAAHVDQTLNTNRSCAAFYRNET
jgi:hypothetical protein